MGSGIAENQRPEVSKLDLSFMRRMLSSNYLCALAFSFFTLPLARAQFVSSLPQCVQDCINQSQDDNCSVADIACLCRASAGNFLPDLITCIHGQCDNDLDNNLLLTPLQWACDLAGAPIPESALRNAENQASSLAAQVTTTVTIGGSSATGGAEATTTIDAGSVTTVTVITTEAGSIIALVYPVTEWSTTTVSGSPSTVTSVSTPSNDFTGLTPVVITSTDSAGSTYTSTTIQPGAISTYTTTDSRGSTTTQRTTFTTNKTPSSTTSSGAVASDTSVSSSTTVTTSVLPDKTTSTGTQSKTSTAPTEDQTNSSPFKDTNAAGRVPVGNWLGLSVLLAVGCVWV